MSDAEYNNMTPRQMEFAVFCVMCVAEELQKPATCLGTNVVFLCRKRRHINFPHGCLLPGRRRGFLSGGRRVAFRFCRILIFRFLSSVFPTGTG